MAKTATQNRFDGGIAEDIRTTATNQCADSTNFDIFSNPHKLIHLRDMLAEEDGSQTIANTKISEVGQTVISTTQYMVALGENYPTDTKPAFYTRTANDLNGSWSAQAVGVAGYNVVHGSYIQYNNVSYCLGSVYSGSYTINLQQYTTAGTLTAIDTVSYTLPSGVISLPEIPKPFVHPKDNRMYLGVGNSMSQWNGSGSFVDYNSLLPSGYAMNGITNFGDDLVIAMSPNVGTGDSLLCIWDRNPAHDTYLSQVINCGQGRIDAVDNLDGNIVVVMSPSNTNLVVNNTLTIKMWNGGEVQTIPGLTDLTTYSNGKIVKVRKDNKLYFVRYGDIAVYCFGKNKQGRYVITHANLVNTGSTATSDKVATIYGLSFVGDCLYVGFTAQDNTYRLMATDFDGSIASINPAVYTTTINPSMPSSDRDEMKKLVGVQVLFKDGGGTCTLEYAVDSTTFVTIDSADMTNLNIIEASAQNDSSPFKDGREFQFRITTTWGTDIIGIRYKYEIVKGLTS